MIEKLEILGFEKEDDTSYSYKSNEGYIISVKVNERDIKKSKIDYGNKIKVHNKSTCNLSKDENIVVLECVIRLLEKGYQPQLIELEKEWRLGHKGKGRLDVLLRSPNKKAYAMIECKTWGEEYSKFRNKTLEEGDQLFSYFIQEREARGLYLYCSKFENERIEVITESIDTNTLSGSNFDEVFKSWDKTFTPKGLFTEGSDLYDAEYKNLLKGELQELDRDSGKELFNSFAEILRRHTVSDKSNAFNKIFNLFVCKIYDEDTKTDDEELDFQWKNDDTYESLLERMATLYKNGLFNYLQIDIQKEYFSSFTEFSFIDIYDELSYTKNMQILREVVELLQVYHIKYSSKHQFLGDFFENLLNTGIKQESGQFFTPIPLSRFLLKSIPIEKIIEQKINNKEINILPYIIDFACGSGHFLTEAMDEIQEHIEKIDYNRLTGRAKTMLLSLQSAFLWAGEYVYGIEKDYRLSKTTKIATFLNGDGDATIINGDGLDDFYTSSSYKGRIKSHSKSRELGLFDVVVSNPPFSVSNFKRYVEGGSNNFKLYKYLTFKSVEIECLFLERTEQLLKENGFAGIILPINILGRNNTIYRYTRKKMLIDFDIVGITELGNKTFSATTTVTVALFLKKRKKSTVLKMLKKLYEYFIEEKKDKAIEAIANTFSSQYEIDENYLWYLFIEEKELLLESLDNMSIDLLEVHDDIVLLLSYCLNFENKTVLSYAGDSTKEQVNFLGYKFSSGRSKEGIQLIKNNGKYVSSLYNVDDSADKLKINTHIKANFLNEKIEIPEKAEQFTKVVDTIDLLTKENFIINNPSQYFVSTNVNLKSNSPFGDFIDEYDVYEYPLGDLMDDEELEWINGLTYSGTDEVPYVTSKRVITASNIDLGSGRLVADQFKYLREDKSVSKEIIPQEGDIIISMHSGSLKHLGKVAYVEEDDVKGYVGGFLSIIRSKENKMLTKAIFYNLLSLRFREFILSLRDQNINTLPPNQLRKFVVKVPIKLEEFYQQAIEKEDARKELEKLLNQ
ncbi:N-6 DNA methylase [Bacillus safensis]|uniref:N-6 DNA methylase n=1 Tax=Bacillus safensis TaxID=561879 RepID=UPI0022AA721D|nr:N-6 DNA methylase [Bacillus safensis]MCZ2737561.1 N-6 DNA methylase [Bacillus safensis]